jgi:cyclohexanone monooxygenase
MLVITSIEQHVEFISAAIAYMRDHLPYALTTMETTAASEDEWVDHCNAIASKDKIKTHETCNSWYLGANIPGKVRAGFANTALKSRPSPH